MLEAYTTLGYLAARTERVRAAAPGSPRSSTASPACSRRSVTTLDVLSGGPGLARHRRGVERGGVARARAALPADRRAVRAPRGGAADLPADVERRRGRRTTAGTTSSVARSTRRALHAAAPTDPDRRWRRAEDAAAGRAVRRGVQPVRQPGPRAQARRAAQALRGRRPRLRRDREDRDDASSTPVPTARRLDDLLVQLDRMHKLGVAEVHGRFPDMHDLKRIRILGERGHPGRCRLLTRPRCRKCGRFRDVGPQIPELPVIRGGERAGKPVRRAPLGLRLMSKVLSAVAWPYANGPRHIGHVSGFGVPSDVFSRYMRMAGHDVLMVSGTDEHGTPILVQADAEGVTPRELADRYNRRDRRGPAGARAVLRPVHPHDDAQPLRRRAGAVHDGAPQRLHGRADHARARSRRRPAAPCPTATSRAPARSAATTARAATSATTAATSSTRST